MKRKLFTTALLLGALCLQLGVSAASSGQSTLQYNGKGEQGYQVDYLRPGAAKPAVASARTMSLTNIDTSESFAYCLDVEKTVTDNHKYAIANVEDVNYPNKETAGKIRGILRNSYPFITLETVASRSGLEVLNAKEAITAAQMAIWELTNGGTYTVNLHPDDGNLARTHALLGWYRTLPPAAPQDPVAYLETKSTLLPDGTLDIAYRPVTGGNLSGVTMATPLLSDNVKFEKKAKDEQDFYHIWVASPPASFTVHFRAAQDLILDTYFYAPVGGKTASQYLAGVRSGNAQLEKVETFSGTAVLDGGIRILKFDSGSNAPLAGVTFSVATDTAFSQNLRFCVTDSNGSATVDSLAPGTYYVREDKPLAGYIPAEGYSTITVAHDTVQLPIKNTRYSTLIIEKVDDKTSAPLAGAKFNIYKGVGTSGTLLFADVTVNALGIFTQEKLLPGTYTIVETIPPAGYQKNPTPQTITLVAGETATVRFVNQLIDVTTTGKLHIIKRDTHTKVQLAGAEFSVYRDRALTQLVASGIVSKADTPAELAGLEPGVYYVKETKVPTGYTLSTALQKVTLEANKTATVYFYNEKIIATAGNYGTLLLTGLGAGGVCGLGWLGLLLYKRQSHGKAE